MGTGGTGKTTLATSLSQHYEANFPGKGLPFVSTSGSSLFDKYGVSSHTDLLRIASTNINKVIDYQYDLLEYSHDKLSKYDSFITDRSPVDNLVYFFLQCAPYISEKRTQDYINKCRELYLDSLGFFIQKIPPNNNINNGVRVDNRAFQEMGSSVFSFIIKNYFYSRNIIPILDIELIKRMNKILSKVEQYEQE